MVEQGGVQALSDLRKVPHAEPKRIRRWRRGPRMFKKIETGDEEAISIWQWFKDLTLKDAKSRIRCCWALSFRLPCGRSVLYGQDGPGDQRNCAKKKLLKESDGAYVVDLEEYGMPPCS